MKKSITLFAGISKAAREAKNLIKLSDIQKEILGDEKFLEQWLTLRAIVYWFMDDGSAHRTPNNIIDYVTLSTNGFNKKENEMLSKIINFRYGFTSRVAQDDTHYYLYFSRVNVELFRSLVSPYIHTDF